MVCVHLAAKIQGLFNQRAFETEEEGVPSVQTVLSFRGLSTVSQGEFSEQDLSRMELVVLRGLDWNLRSRAHDTLDWIDVMSSLVDMDNEPKSSVSNAFKELIFDQLQKLTLGSHRLLQFAPSKLALAIFTNGAKDGGVEVDIMAMLALVRMHDKDMMRIQNEIRCSA
jgi:hypothetical protein